MQAFVRDNNVDQAGTFLEMIRRRSSKKPSDPRVRGRAAARHRHRKAMRKRLEREGY